MNTINISLNNVIATRMKDALKQKGYNNVSEYIRDLLRRDLHIESHDSYGYDMEFLKKLEQETRQAVKNKKVKKLTSLDDLRK